MAQSVAPRPRTNPAPDPNGLPLAPPQRRRRRWSLALVGALVTVGSALAFAVLWMNAGEREPVVAVAQRVPAGQVIGPDDVQILRVSTDPGLDPIPGGQLDQVIGSVAATDLVPGTLLTSEHLDADRLLERGTAVVGVALRPGQLPSGLERGNLVQVVLTAAPGSSSETLGGVLTEGRVFHVGDRNLNNGSLVVSLVVDEDEAAEIAGAASLDLVSLVLVPAR